MKTNELMIGDYVKFLGKVRKIKSIVGKDTGIEISFEGKNPVAVSLDEIEPIPLTPEILEKNGFTSYGEAWYLPENKETGNEKIFVGFYMYETHISVRNGSKSFDNSVPCEYRACAVNRHVFIHELQHAIRLCGIEKKYLFEI